MGSLSPPLFPLLLISKLLLQPRNRKPVDKFICVRKTNCFVSGLVFCSLRGVAASLLRSARRLERLAFKKLPPERRRLPLPSRGHVQQGRAANTAFSRAIQRLCCRWSVHGLQWLFYVQVSAMIPCQSVLRKNAKDLPLGEPSQGFIWQRSLILFQEKLCGHTKRAAYCYSSISPEKKRNKVSLMPHSTYLFIPCPQSNAKKCYAKELKRKIKIKKYQNRNYKFIDLFI